jgi:cystathionine beta-lyase/cystathionine gamma-synthase
MTERDFSLDNLDLSTLSLHADVLGGPEVNGAAVDLAIAPALSVTTTFIRPEGGAELQDAELPPGTHIYSRYTQPVRDRVERVLAAVNKASKLGFTLRCC